jgi:hypothetical protein
LKDIFLPPVSVSCQGKIAVPLHGPWACPVRENLAAGKAVDYDQANCVVSEEKDVGQGSADTEKTVHRNLWLPDECQ